ncbi:MAG: hypothetical protein HRT71_18080 [Flavobacteriales bacterium]|nr:hypothetical protein [Flavobacteriales bacterium]
MNTIIKILVLVLAAVGIGKGYSYFRKYKNLQKLEVAVSSFKLPGFKITNLLEDILVDVVIGVNNFSDSLYSISQLKIDIYLEDGVLLAKQIKSLESSIEILPKQEISFSLSYLIPSSELKKLIASGGGIKAIGVRYFTEGVYGFHLELKGFIESEGVIIKINKKINV